MGISVTIVITTKDRKEDLVRCLDSCVVQKDVGEILVFDDGGNDGTFAYVKKNYPLVSLYRSTKSLGLINARTKCASLAKGEIIVSIDDDCVFQGTETICEIVQYFSHDKIAAITIPLINVFSSNKIIQKGVNGINDIYICSQFMGGAHAIRRDIFLQLRGYYNNLVRQEEETEFAMRLYNAGYVIRVADCSLPILHYHSTKRNNELISFYRSRNQLLVSYRLVPLPIMPFVLLSQALSTIRFEIFKNKHIRACFSGYRDALVNIFRGRIQRNPIGWKQYYHFKTLRMSGYKKIVL